MKFSTYLFDFDGTLVDSMPTFGAVMLRILDEEGVKYPDDIIKIITPLGYLGTAKYFIENFGIKASVDDLLSRMNSYAYKEYAESIPAKSSVIEVLKALRADGASLNILTASPHTVLDACLGRLGITELFTNIWSCDDFATTKSNPEIYKMAAEKIGKSVGEILFLDDNLGADETAKLAGMPVCGVFDESSADYAEKIRAVCDYYIKDFSELLKI
jgi:HAD superfamily hydrolase (TIGR01509 family)